MKIKKGDKVKILVGKDRGKSGKVLTVINPAKSPDVMSGSRKAGKNKKNTQIVVEGLNLRYKHLRPRREREKGQRIMFPAPMDISDIQLVCPKCGKPTRVGFKIREGKSEITKEKKQRICKKCKAII